MLGRLEIIDANSQIVLLSCVFGKFDQKMHVPPSGFATTADCPSHCIKQTVVGGTLAKDLWHPFRVLNVLD